MSYKKIFYKKKLIGELITAKTRVNSTVFYSPKESSFQFGLFAHSKGFFELPHYHKKIKRKIYDLQQVLFVQKGELSVNFYNNSKKIIKRINLKKGDALNIVGGVHSVKVKKNCQCLTVKQGPFISDKEDKVNV